MPSSPSTLQLSNRCALLPGRVDSQFLHQGTSNKQSYSYNSGASTSIFISSYFNEAFSEFYSFFFSGDGSSEVKSESPFPTDELGDIGTVSIVSS